MIPVGDSKPNAARVAVVTGSSRGLGAATAKRLAGDGFFIVLNFVKSREGAEEVLAEVVRAGPGGLIVQGDVSTVDGIGTFFKGVDAALEKAGMTAMFDVLVANAGLLISKPFAETTESDFDSLFNANVKGVFFLIQKALPRLRDGGRIVTLSSGLSRYANPMYTAYSATKGAVDVITRVMAQEVGVRGITVNAVAPGATDTDMTASWLRTDAGKAMLISRQALKRVGAPPDIADVISFLAGPDSRWITGQRIEVSGGSSL